MKLKLDDQGHAVLQDGAPVYIHPDGKEIAFDGLKAFTKIGDLTKEAATNRTRAEGAEAQAKAFEGIDIALAKDALEKVKNLDSKQLIAAGERDRAVSEAVKAVEDRYKPIVSAKDKLEARLVELQVGGGFSGSKFANEKLVAKGPAGAEMARALFGPRFKVVGEKVVGHDASGNALYSRTTPGEIAGFDEALELMVEGYQFKDSILAASGASGGGAQNSGNAGGGSGRKTVTREQFEAMPQGERMAFSKAGGAIGD